MKNVKKQQYRRKDERKNEPKKSDR